MARQQEGAISMFHKHGIDFAELDTSEDPIPVLHSLLKRRIRKRQR
jgi:hypothetical protein